MLASMATVVSAAETTTTKTTTLTTSVPAATYTLNIPEDQTIKFGATQTRIGDITVTDAVGFAAGKNLNIKLTYDAFKCDEVSTEIPFKVYGSYSRNGKSYDYNIPSGEALLFEGRSDGALDVPEKDADASLGAQHLSGIGVKITSEDWGKALAGEYTATITFTAEVVVEE